MSSSLASVPVWLWLSRRYGKKRVWLCAMLGTAFSFGATMLAGEGDVALLCVLMTTAGISAGCGDGRYCPEAPVTRAQMAVFLVRAKAPGFVPPPASGLFTDVPATYWAGAWIEQIARDFITAGCGGGRFCPESLVSRAEMAVFLARAFGLGP